ncbi:hypothetical protein H0E87_007306 [Populus deltoides]|uniref:DNA-directed RNA polymerase III subunit n=1 Tax=Populus deltoides TaxID=3696 RepID=A0A8T2ZAC7_POPDE|nr:hypothetical protein H0E87_007306 [Populus deltoides]
MAYRGRGRGRFGGGGGFSYARQEPFDLFPEIELPDPKNVKEERALVVWNSRLTNYFKSSPCYLEEIVSKGLNRKRPNKKVKWTADLRKLDDYEKRELMYEGQAEKVQMEKKEDEDEEDEDEELEEPDDEYDDGDYNQNIDFDDDEDDYNMEDDNADEAVY